MTSQTSPTAYLWRRAALLAATALISALLLTGTSAWFLASVALVGLGPAALTFNFHFPAAFVRLFALSRTAAKYGERVTGHQAALADQVARRIRLFAAMAAAPATRSAGWQLARQDRLGDFLDDVEDLDYARLRVGLPLTLTLGAAAALAAATLWLAPLALVPVFLLCAALWALQQNLLSDATAEWSTLRATRRTAAAGMGAAFAALIPLRAERQFDTTLATSFTHLAAADQRECRLLARLGLLDAALTSIGPMMTLSVLIAAWEAGARGAGLLPAAFLAFAWLAFADQSQTLARAALGEVRRRQAAHSLAHWHADPKDAAPAPETGTLILTLDNLTPATPDGRTIGAPVSLTLYPGTPLMLTGPSGCGKTGLLKQIAGWLPAAGKGHIHLQVPNSAQAIHLCLHDAAILDDTLRENLFAPEATEEALWLALDAMELTDRIRDAGGLMAWLTQDRLSLGEAQRLNLARAWLSPAPLVLLDEPTEHLDADQGARILARLAAHFEDRLLICACHHGTISGARVLTLS